MKYVVMNMSHHGSGWFLRYIFARFRQKPLKLLITLVMSTKFVLENLRLSPKFKDRYELFRHSISKVSADGLFFEFGVANGDSINFLASLTPDITVYGFDSFEGIPEAWGDMPKGYFRLNELPKVRRNVKLVVGLFQETLEPFLEGHTEKAKFIHMDADLYSSTKYVLFTLAKNNRLMKGTIIQFDELFNYLGWWDTGEYKAFIKFVREFNVAFEYLGYVLTPGARAIQNLSGEK